MNGAHLQLAEVYKYLGFLLKYNLNWDLHVNNLRKSTRKFIHIIKVAAGINWGAYPLILISIYKV